MRWRVENAAGKDTVKHVLDAVDGTLRLVELLELFAEVEEAVVVHGERDVLLGGLGQQAHPQMELSVGTEHERTAAMIRMNGFRDQEPLELHASNREQVTAAMWRLV